jgi:SAM-dependent methyltransferase
MCSRNTLGDVSQAEFWEEHAKAWVRWAREPGHDTYWRFHRDRFLELLPQPGRLTVDVGCGEGRLARDLKALGHRVVALDSSATMVRHAREADPDLDVREADATALPLDDAAADLVVSFMSLMNTDELGTAVREAARVLGRDGRYCVAITHPLHTAGEFESEDPAARFVVERSYFEHAQKEVRAERSGLEMTFLDTHRPLEDYFRALVEAGLLVERLSEVTDERDAQWRRIPLFLDLRAVKKSNAGSIGAASR